MTPEEDRGQRDRGPSLSRALLQDLREARRAQTLKQDFRQIYRFYVDEEGREKLAAMGRVKRAFVLVFWILKSMLLKLSAGRRLAVFIALLLFLVSRTVTMNLAGREVQIRSYGLGLWSFIILLVVFMLELKDKLLARDEIAVARQVQIALLPKEHPQPPGWSLWSVMQPANDVGGDLVDYLPLEAGRLGIVLGDVSGKGLGAALLMAKLQATLRAFAPDCASLGELGCRLNAILERDGLPNRFATLFYCEIDPASGRVRYINAGHNPPFVVRPGGIEDLKASSVPLGMFPDSVFTEELVDLNPGDMLAVYSDGLTEARNVSEEEFGETRLRAELPGLAALQPEEAGRRLAARVEEFIGTAPRHDDISIVILARRPSRSPHAA